MPVWCGRLPGPGLGPVPLGLGLACPSTLPVGVATPLPRAGVQSGSPSLSKKAEIRKNLEIAEKSAVIG